MNLTISYRHLESTPAIAKKITDKAEHLNKYFESDVKIDWVCAVDGHVQRSEVNVHSGHDHFHATAEDQNLYKTLDDVLAKIESQIRKKNSKTKKRLHINKSDLIKNEVEED